ncbi:LCP family protein [Streptomyces griseus]|uniref:LCP family protein n=1 Tax=Streptomyces griseus TaxID=1911 RepID=UPI0008402DD3|nr:LCP family protein [Streptomyces griseus]
MEGRHRTARAHRDAAPGRRRKRGRGGRLVATAVALLVLVTAGVGWLYVELNGDISTFGADGLSDNRPAASTKGQNVLVIGSDARTGGNEEFGGGDKHDIGRSDTAFLFHVYADQRHAVAVSFPRDTLVDIPPCRLPDGTWTKPQSNVMFNSAYTVGQTAEGNPACTQNTVEKLTGLRVDHTVVVDFKGFAALTDVVDGVRVCLPDDVYRKDLNPKRATRGERIFAKGEQIVSGQEALDYVRLRHGIGDGSDIGRIKRQQAFVASLLKKVKSDGLTPTRLLPLANAATKSLTVDPGLGSADKLISFAMSLKDIDLHNTKFVTIPWRYQGARVAIVEPEADALWAALKADRTLDGKNNDATETAATATPTPVSGQGIAVAVYNGTRTTGLAARAAETLKEADFTVTGTATAATQNHTATVIEYGPGRKDQAETVARLFATTDLLSVSAAGINVILGQSYADHPTATLPNTPAVAPTKDTRSADDDPCSNLSYG